MSSNSKGLGCSSWGSESQGIGKQHKPFNVGVHSTFATSSPARPNALMWVQSGKQAGFHLGCPRKPFACVDRVCFLGRACLSRLPTSQASRQWEVGAASGTTGSRSGLEAPLPDGTLQIGGLEKCIGLFFIETMTSFHLGVPWSEPCFCGDTASLSSSGPSVSRS